MRKALRCPYLSGASAVRRSLGRRVMLRLDCRTNTLAGLNLKLLSFTNASLWVQSKVRCGWLMGADRTPLTSSPGTEGRRLMNDVGARLRIALELEREGR